ncbi:nucleotidyltransferase family protein [Sulfobacillus harzensis]|uniref:Nucleotidyltransferase domain-containing protein n=1 Tax=Sulfobacillus harzensis TaxID=2729629 RepID=A0A7Y0Q2M2_9FIRM|nr:nucleotidyltransferase domain-containing protein [Sulfobacillus harzensis]NMP23328.1 nucleotidyltransferase domain-containing protein [Sulfobacillus harzensis]
MEFKGIPWLSDEALQPHRDLAVRVISNLVQEPGVRTIYLEGSLARGTADAYSDVDLRVVLDPHFMPNMWRNRHRIADIPGQIWDLDHQWGDSAQLSYAVLYEPGVYLDLTFVESHPVQLADAVVLWTATEPRANAGTRHNEPVDIHLDPMDDALRMFWIGSPLCAKHLRRRQLWTAHGFIESRRTLFLKIWRLVHAPSRADWGWSKVEEELPRTVLEDLAMTVTPLEYSALSQSLTYLMTMMAHYGPGLAKAYGLSYPEAQASTVARMVSQMLARG